MHGAADDVRSAAEAALPEPVAQDGRARRAGLVIVFVERAAQERSYAEHLEESSAHARAWQSLRLGANGDREPPPA
jgi:hypothetical protein